MWDTDKYIKTIIISLCQASKLIQSEDYKRHLFFNTAAVNTVEAWHPSNKKGFSLKSNSSRNWHGPVFSSFINILKLSEVCLTKHLFI